MSNGQRIMPEYQPAYAMPRSMYNKVGTGADTVVSPASAKYLVTRAVKGAWNLRPGRDVALTVSAVTAAADTLTVTGHGLRDGFGPYFVASTTTLPGGVTASTNYWVKVVDANTLKLATSLDALGRGVYVDITSAGSGTITIEDDPATALPGTALNSSSVTNGSAPFYLAEGQEHVFPAPKEFSMRGYASDSVLLYFWL